MKSILLFTSLYLFLACKESSKAIKKESIIVIDSTTSVLNKNIDKKDLILNTCIGDEQSPILKLPVNGGNNLMANTFEEGIKLQELKCSIDKMKPQLCNSDYVNYYQLPKKGELLPIIIEDECGDNNNYILAVFYQNELIDNILIYSYWTDMEEGNSKEKIKDFKINKDYEIKISDSEFQNKKKTNYKINKYRINKTGKIIKIKNNSLMVGSIVYAQVETYLNMRSAPNSNGDIIAKAYPKDGLKVIEVLDGWLKIELNGKQGYVSSEFVK
ncbi:SH3 domain-containing protein [Tenacibaculum finnmarkense]|uniref:SH3 domain-containing protein n=1 Tax=Tenacibaculum finnmarkense genomovar finnmarkense TaxID=1458503 RepID=A0AAP1RH41_9FLAO|nr:SH3 domain-containing protein [Tenacibaculum finnmarkense]MBE7653801.1 SH3 domain-containing protein [Tenacibaculum finnmarkense genomovar finnmarkense]MBE7661053.1 SH3 domain-containing protein [Tenacibaculum finnmarkense genomovar finnmarkense]MBE7696105.1 SH3 domain-containing protein [Tenacibaculum finnmarkense genomovar finnmarkense]MCD8428340.1 SH3 domain-containing protein [Tenacibaculum finnmarkense genomovar finnmarkense]MCD8440812.1 SH3 domain-containing protein [Tenacibaculum fin